MNLFDILEYLVYEFEFRGRDGLSRYPGVPARLDRCGEWHECEGCGVRQRAGGIPMVYQPDGRRFCFRCDWRDPESSRRFYSQFWTPGECSRWPRDRVAERRRST